MVVARRAPVTVPLPPPARNQPPQGTQRPSRASSSKGIAIATMDAASDLATAASVAGPSNGNRDHRNGLDNNPGKESKKSRRRAKKKHQKSNFQAFLDFLTKLLLLAFTIYTFAVCPQDTHLQSPICRGLTEYRRIVLDPYIIPPIQAVLAHPSIAPHIERATPYVHRAVEITAPILLRTQQEWNLHVVPQWENRVLPEWNKRVVPQWNKYVVPQLDKHVTPRIRHVQSKLEPYRLRVTQKYEQRILPRARVAFYNLQRWQRQAQPYVLLAASKTKDGYYAAKPYAIPIAKRCGRLLQQVVLFLREQRQMFVDPHVAKMWEKVKELSRGRHVTQGAPPERGSSSPDIPFTVVTREHENTASTAPSPTPAYDVIPTQEETDVAQPLSPLDASEATEAVPHTTFAEPTLSPVPEPTTPTQLAGTPTDLGTPPSAESVPAECLQEPDPSTSGAYVLAGEISAVTSPMLVAATTALSSNVPPIADEPATPLTSARPSKITAAVAKATVPPANSRAEDEIDLDAFYAELGLDEPLGNSGGSEVHSSGPSSPPAETDEERAERIRIKAEETARKRADIEARQAKWEAELQAQVEHSTLRLQARLGNLRTAAAAELASSAEVRNSIDELVNDAEKYLKGAEIYLKNLKGESRKPDEKLALWDRVADRVNDKFNERLSTTEGMVKAWCQIVLDKELQEVATASAEVREVAEKGQLDLGLDYAWLEDVTYEDWQRYHALIEASEQYAQQAASIQNGTHPRVLMANPLSPIFEDLESEVADVVIGFETRMRRIKRDGERAFNAHNGNGAEKGLRVEPEPEASILPVSGEGVPPVVIGRSKEEVLEALARAEQVPEGEVAESSVDPGEAVSRLAQEVEGHTEL